MKKAFKLSSMADFSFAQALDPDVNDVSRGNGIDICENASRPATPMTPSSGLSLWVQWVCDNMPSQGAPSTHCPAYGTGSGLDAMVTCWLLWPPQIKN